MDFVIIKARGIVMELGGMLSHGAVLLEYGVPAVAAVDQACSLFRSGEKYDRRKRRAGLALKL